MSTGPNAARIEDLDAIATPSGTDLILFMSLSDESGDSVEVTRQAAPR